MANLTKIFLPKLLLALICCNFAFAFSPEERLANDQQEELAVKIFQKTRCLVCGGQTIDSSNSQFSYDLRQFIRQKVSQNLSEAEIEEELVKKFGQEILLKPSNSTSLSIIMLAVALSCAFLAFIVKDLGFKNSSRALK